MTTTAPAPRPARTAGSRWGRRIVLLFVFLLAIAGILYITGALEVQPQIAIVTASQDPYWDLVITGARAAAERSKVRLIVIRPPSDPDEQARQVQELLEQKIDGIAISPISPSKETALLSQIASKTNLVTIDSDSPLVGRLCFVGTDSYTAGRMCGEQVRQAAPDGGEIMISIGTLEKENGRLRRQGVIDELLDRSYEPARASTDASATEKGPRYTILTVTDDLDPEKATKLTAQAIKDHPNLKCIVGIFAYSTPAILKALEQTHKLGEIPVVGFDVNERTLQGIEAGHVKSSMMQDMYSCGFEAVRILADAARGNRSGLPAFQMHYLACTVVDKDNIAAIRQQLKGSSASPAPTNAPGGNATSNSPPATKPAPSATQPTATP